MKGYVFGFAQRTVLSCRDAEQCDSRDVRATFNSGSGPVTVLGHGYAIRKTLTGRWIITGLQVYASNL